MTETPKLTWKGRLIAFGVSAVLCIAVIEGVARQLEGHFKSSSVLEVDPHPYLMNVGRPLVNWTWRNIFTNTDVPSSTVFNNLGFNVDGDFSTPPNEGFTSKYAKESNDKIVLITGGSVIHGVGATANSRTTAGQLEAILNEKQSKYRYRVVNLGNAGWIAYQQFIALSLYGMPLKPDWIVVMDGHNDANISCPHGSGAGNPLSWPVMLHLFTGSQNLKRRSAVMDWLVRNVAAARILTGARQDGTASGTANHILEQLYLDDSEADNHFRIKMRDVDVGVLDEQLKFYLLAEKNVKELFSTANILFSSQPYFYNNAVSQWYRKAFDFQATAADVEASKRRLNADLDAYIAREAKSRCDSSVAAQALGYFMGRSALRLETAAAAWAAESKSRGVLYANTEMVLPAGPEQRQPNFIDNAHLSDLGQRRIAGFFAGNILKTDLAMPFNPAEYAEAISLEATKALGRQAGTYRYSPPSSPPTKVIAGKRVLEGLTSTERSPGATQLNEGADAGFHRVLWIGVPATPGRSNTMTVDAWTDRAVNVRLEMADSSNSYGRADFDLLGQKTIATNGNKVVAQIQDLGGGWRRLALTLPLAADTLSFNVSILSADGEVNYPGGNRGLVITEPAVRVE